MQGQIFVKGVSALTSLVLLLTVVFGFSACSSPEEPVGPPELRPTRDIPTEMLGEPDGRQNPHLEALELIREQISRQVLASQVDMQDLQAAYIQRDVKAIQRMIGLNTSELEAMSDQLKYHSSQLLHQEPELQAEIERRQAEACTECELNTFFDNHETYLAPAMLGLSAGTSGKSRVDAILATETVDCRWGPYYASLIVCAASGPLLYWPCAYLAICTYCGGGWVDDACFAESVGDTGGSSSSGGQ